MAPTVVLDSSVIVAALREAEPAHSASLQLMTKVAQGDYLAIVPNTVLVEVVAAIRRRTGNQTLAQRVGSDLLQITNIHFQSLTKHRTLAAMEIASETGVRGMDAIVIQTARENNTALVTLDKEMAKRARQIVTIKNVDEF